MLEQVKTRYTQADLRAFDILRTPIWVFDIDHLRIWWANQAALCLWHATSREELLARNFSDVPDSVQLQLQRYLQRLQQGERITDHWILHPNGQPTTVSCQLSGIYLEDGRLALLVEVVPKDWQQIDQNTLKSLQDSEAINRALRESEHRYATLAKLSPVGIFHTDAIGNCLYVNKQWCQMVGLDQSAALGKGWLNAIYPPDRDRVVEAWEHAVQTHSRFNLEYRFQKTDGTVIWVLGQAVEEFDEQGAGIGFVGTITNISERKQCEAVLQHANEVLEQKFLERTLELETALKQYRTLVEQIPGVVYTSPTTGTSEFTCVSESTCVYVSPQIQALLNIPVDQWHPGFYGSWQNYIHPDDRDWVLQMLQSCIETQAPFHCEYRLMTQDGNTVWVQDQAKLVLAADGSTQMLQGLALDISDRKCHEQERKQTEAALQQSEAKYRRIVETVSEGIWELDENSQTTFVNQYMATMLGYTVEEMVGTSLFEFMDEEGRKTARQNVERRRQGIQEQHDFKFRCKNGSDLWAMVSTQSIVDEAGNYQGVLGLVTDISDRKRTEEALREREAQLRLALQAARMGTWDWDISQNMLTYSAQLSRFLGLPLGTTHSTYQGFLRTIHADDRQRVDEAVRQALNEDSEYEIAYRTIWQDGSLHWIDSKGKVYRDHQGTPIRMIGVAVDITVQKQAETRILKALEKEKELGELKSRFVSMTSHEFRTPLTTIQSSIDLLEHYPCDEAEKQELLQQIRNAIEQMVQLLEGILLLGQTEAKGFQLKPGWLDLKSFCSSQVKAASLNSNQQCLINFEAQGENAQAFLDEKMMRQILINLLTNAIRYSSNAQSIHLKLICEDTADNKDQVILQVQDRGIGIPSEDIPHLFEFFHRAKNVGTISGTGLGLAIVKKCVDVCKGKISVQSEIGVGTIVTVVLPRIMQS